MHTVVSAPTWTWAIPLVASLLALLGVLISVTLQWRSVDRQLRSSHALKIAEMRQAWINNLRDAMSTFQSYGVAPTVEHHLQREFYECGTKIELFMNPKDPDFEELHRCMEIFLDARTLQEKYDANHNYIAVCQRILKREWQVLKDDVYTAGQFKRMISKS